MRLFFTCDGVEGITYSKSSSSDSSIKSEALGTKLSSNEAVQIGVGAVTDVQGAILNAPKVDFVRSAGADTSQDGQLLLGGSTNTTQTSHTEKTTTAGVYQEMSGHGETKQTYNQTQINGKVNIATGINTTVVIPEGDLKKQVEALSQQPGLEYLNELAKDPRINWQQVKLAYDKWNYSQAGLTPAGAALLSIAVAVVTNGMGSELLGSTVTAATGASTTAATATTAAITTYTTAGAAINAGFSALAAQAGVSLVNNGGDIGKTLDQLGNSSTVKNILAAMTTAGVGAAYAGAYTAESALANVAAGCASSTIGGGKCEQGATIAAGLQGLSYLGDLARKDQIASSAKFPGVVDADGNVVNNLSGQSSGINGDLSKIGGERLSIDKICSTVPTMCQQDANGLNSVKAEFIDAQGRYVLPTTGAVTTALKFSNAYTSAGISPLGGLQGGQGAIFGNPYAAGSFTDKVVESFAGAHDWLNSFHYYDPLTGNNLPANLSGSSFWNPMDVFLAAPVGLSTLNTQVPILSTIKAGVDASKQETKK